jgi:hypothetical protein
MAASSRVLLPAAFALSAALAGTQAIARKFMSDAATAYAVLSLRFKN